MEGHPYEEFVKLTFRNCQIVSHEPLCQSEYRS
jgi:hypothetical protein